jgi:hypothetical protein
MAWSWDKLDLGPRKLRTSDGQASDAESFLLRSEAPHQINTALMAATSSQDKTASPQIQATTVEIDEYPQRMQCRGSRSSDHDLHCAARPDLIDPPKKAVCSPSRLHPRIALTGTGGARVKAGGAIPLAEPELSPASRPTANARVPYESLKIDQILSIIWIRAESRTLTIVSIEWLKPADYNVVPKWLKKWYRRWLLLTCFSYSTLGSEPRRRLG